MDKVFIVIEEDSNDESRILRVFSDKTNAESFKNISISKGFYERIFIEEWEVWK